MRNSAEAIKENGVVAISLHSIGQRAVIRVRDNGKGIPSNVLPFIFDRQFSYGKQKASSLQRGIGLGQVKKSVESWDGSISVVSKEKLGTTFSLSLPRSTPPSWFVSKLPLKSKETLTLVSDDKQLYDVWKEKIIKFNKNHHADISINHFLSFSDFEAWRINYYQSRNLKFNQTVLFSMTELGTQLKSDPELNLLKISRLIFLISKTEESLEIKEFLIKNHLGVIGIEGSHSLPLTLYQDDPEIFDIVMIDDNYPLMTELKKQAVRTGKSFTFFSSINEFVRNAHRIDPKSEIWIDSDLGNGLRGEIEARLIHQLGFRNLYCTSYYEDIDLRNCPWIKGRRKKTIL